MSKTVYDNWGEHSCGCELYEPRDGREADRARAMLLKAKEPPNPEDDDT